MKNLRTSSCLMMLFVFALFQSCNKDDSNPTGEDQTDVTVSEFENVITANGGTFNDGNPPASNTSIDFELIEAYDAAFPDVGLRFSYETEGTDIAGAYLQFFDEEGNRSSRYYDFPAEDENEGEVSFTFNNSLPNFNTICYEICIYDAQNNVSQPQTVCLSYLNWGGDYDIVGNWIRYDEEDNTTEIYCDNGNTVVVPSANNELDEWKFVLEQNGDYHEVYYNESEPLDLEASAEQCEAVYGDLYVEEHTMYYGKWSFNPSNNRLYVFDAGTEDYLNPDNNEVYEALEIYIASEANVIDENLVLTEDGETLIFNPDES